MQLLSDRLVGALAAEGGTSTWTPDVRELATAVVDPASTHPLGVYAFRPTDAGAALALAVERSMLEEADEEEAGRARASYETYDETSVFLCVVDQHHRVPAGAARVIVPSPRGLRSLTELDEVWGMGREQVLADLGIVNDAARTWDVATLAVADDFRALSTKSLVLTALLQALSLIAVRCDMPWSVAVLDEPALRLLQWKLHQPFTEFPDVEPAPTPLSEASLPVWGCVHDWHRRLAARDAGLYEVMAEGRGLESVVRPADWDAMAAVVREVAVLADLPRLH